MLIPVRRGKGNKDRYLLLGETMLTLLREYYQTARRKGEYLFSGQKAQNPITTSSISMSCPEASSKSAPTVSWLPATPKPNSKKPEPFSNYSNRK
jgi:site-specific recombinase XerD